MNIYWGLKWTKILPPPRFLLRRETKKSIQTYNHIITNSSKCCKENRQSVKQNIMGGYLLETFKEGLLEKVTFKPNAKG